MRDGVKDVFDGRRFAHEFVAKAHRQGRKRYPLSRHINSYDWTSARPGQAFAELHPLNAAPVSVRMISQTPVTLYETIARLGIDVVWNPQTKPQLATTRFTVDLSNVTLREALDTLASVTKTYWSPVSGSTIAMTPQQ